MWLLNKKGATVPGQITEGQGVEGCVMDFKQHKPQFSEKKIRKSDTISTPTNVCELSAKSLAKEHELT